MNHLWERRIILFLFFSVFFFIHNDRISRFKILFSIHINRKFNFHQFRAYVIRSAATVHLPQNQFAMGIGPKRSISQCAMTINMHYPFYTRPNAHKAQLNALLIRCRVVIIIVRFNWMRNVPAIDRNRLNAFECVWINNRMQSLMN